MGRAKKEKTYIKSIRVTKEQKEFFEYLENANQFVLQLIQNSKEYEKFLKYKQSISTTKSLFEDIIT